MAESDSAGLVPEAPSSGGHAAASVANVPAWCQGILWADATLLLVGGILSLIGIVSAESYGLKLRWVVPFVLMAMALSTMLLARGNSAGVPLVVLRLLMVIPGVIYAASRTRQIHDSLLSENRFLAFAVPLAIGAVVGAYWCVYVAASLRSMMSLGKTGALVDREVKAYLYSPIAYVVMAVFLVITGIFFGLEDLRPGQPAEMRSFFNNSIFILVFVLPIVTMRLVSEEKSTGTIETLMTAPVTDTQVILGKFLGAMLFYLLLLAPTLVYVLLLFVLGLPEPGPILSGYVGLVLIGMLFVAVGLLTSTCTKFQLVSAIISLVFLSIMTFLCYYLGYHVPAWARKALWFVGFAARYQNFVKGTIPLDDVVFFLSVTALTLFLSVKVLESRKWQA